MARRLEDEVAIVTGSTSGLGREKLSAERRAHFERMHPTRLATAADIAASAAYLASADAEVVTGILLPVDGGSSTAARATCLD